MAKAKKTASGKWRVQIYANGKRACFTEKIRADAELKAALWKIQQDRLSDPDCDLESAIRNYIDGSKSVLSPATLRGYEIALKRLSAYRIIYKKIKSITASEMQAVINDLSTKYAPKTVRNTFALVTATRRFYALQPLQGIHLPQEPVKAYSVPSDADVARLLDACAGTPFEVAIMLAAFAGLRRSEIVALTSDDLDGDVLHVHAAVVKGSDMAYHEKLTKTRASDRFVKLPDFVVDRIKDIDGHLYPFAAEGITRKFEKLRVKCGVACRFHDLRAYHASKMHAIGIPDQYVISRLGWSTDYTLKKVYRRELDDVSKAMNQRINDDISATFATKIATED